jgi:hypothetical protein
MHDRGWLSLWKSAAPSCNLKMFGGKPKLKTVTCGILKWGFCVVLLHKELGWPGDGHNADPSQIPHRLLLQYSVRVLDLPWDYPIEGLFCYTRVTNRRSIKFPICTPDSFTPLL